MPRGWLRARMPMSEDEKIEVTPSSGNVFADLGFKDSDERLAKSMLAIQISQVIKTRRLTQAKAAELCGLSQPKISKLVRGDLYGFSTEQLLRVLMALGHDVSIVVEAPSAGSRRRRRGRLTVHAV